jgi:hypothetical protein
MVACYLYVLVNLPKNDPDQALALTRSVQLARDQLA